MNISRKHFLKQAGLFALGFSGLQAFSRCTSERTIDPSTVSERFGPLVKDPEGLFDLPEGFSYRIISRFRDTMDDGLFVPHRPDGMATFPGRNGRTILIINHEVNPARGGAESAFGKDYELLHKIDQEKIYDRGVGGRNPAQGGTTTLIYDTEKQQVVRHYLSLAGTLRNCAGGPTPWNSWLSCEEIVLPANKIYAKPHGYVFEVPASEEITLVDAVPIKAMGCFNHEAVAVDPASGILYMTEDESKGLLYRYIPDTPGELLRGGRLQALSIRDHKSLDTRNWREPYLEEGTNFEVDWFDVENYEEPNNELRFRGFETGAARFARAEGMWFGNREVYFACTNGGKKRLGQIWRYTPGPGEGTSDEKKQPGRLELFVESKGSHMMEHADNLTVAPWGDLIVCEDGTDDQYLVGVTPEGSIYKLGLNAKSTSELAGAVFSPDGSTLFMNIQHDGLTLAITGPWDQQVENS